MGVTWERGWVDRGRELVAFMKMMMGSCVAEPLPVGSHGREDGSTEGGSLLLSWSLAVVNDDGKLRG